MNDFFWIILFGVVSACAFTIFSLLSREFLLAKEDRQFIKRRDSERKKEDNLLHNFLFQLDQACFHYQNLFSITSVDVVSEIYDGDSIRREVRRFFFGDFQFFIENILAKEPITQEQTLLSIYLYIYPKDQNVTLLKQSHLALGDEVLLEEGAVTKAWQELVPKSLSQAEEFLNQLTIKAKEELEENNNKAAKKALLESVRIRIVWEQIQLVHLSMDEVENIVNYRRQKYPDLSVIPYPSPEEIEAEEDDVARQLQDIRDEEEII